MPKSARSTSVPKSMQATYEAITSLTDAFCREHLNEDYAELARKHPPRTARLRGSRGGLGSEQFPISGQKFMQPGSRMIGNPA